MSHPSGATGENVLLLVIYNWSLCVLYISCHVAWLNQNKDIPIHLVTLLSARALPLYYILATRVATATFGRIEEFKPEAESIASYLERIDLYFLANDVAEVKQVPVFLSVVGGKSYELLRNLCALTKPKDKHYQELKDLLKGHFKPKPLVIAERYHFHRRDQAEGESIAEYVAKLRRLSRTCEFGAEYLSEALRDRLVCGIRNGSVQKRLLTEADLTLKRAMKIAQGMEAAGECQESQGD